MFNSDNIYNTTATESGQPTTAEAEDIVRQKNATFERATTLLSTEAIRTQAQRFVEMGLHVGVIFPETHCIEDDQGKKHWYQELGKRPLYEGWPDAAVRDFVKPDEIPATCNHFILCGTPVERDGQIGYVCDVDIDQAFAVPIFLRTFQLFELPTPLKWGHESKRSSHLMYLVDKPTTSISKLCHGIAEIRCQTKGGDYFPYGHQSVTFPSVWCKKEAVELIEQEPDSATEPPLVSCDLVVKAFRTAVAVSLLAPLMPTPPHYEIRNAFFRLAACGGMSLDDAVRFISLVEQFVPEKCKGTKDNFKREAGSIYEIVQNDPAFTKDAEEPTKANLYGFPTILKHIGEDKEQILSDILELLDIQSPHTSKSKTKDDGVNKILTMLEGARITKMNIPPVKYLDDPFILEGATTAFTGGAGEGKSTFVLTRLIDVAAQRDDVMVIHCDRDNPPSVAKDRMLRLCGDTPDKISYWGGFLTDDSGKLTPPWYIDDPRWIILIKKAKDQGKHVVIVFDTLNSFMQGQDENDNGVIGHITNCLRNMTHMGATCVLIHHTGKSLTSKKSRGASSFEGGVDAGWLVEAKIIDCTIKNLSVTPWKSRTGMMQPSNFKMVDGRLVSATGNNIETVLWTFIQTHEGKSRKAIEIDAGKSLQGFSRQTVRDTLDKYLVGGKLKLVSQKVYLKGTVVADVFDDEE